MLMLLEKFPVLPFRSAVDTCTTSAPFDALVMALELEKLCATNLDFGIYDISELITTC